MSERTKVIRTRVTLHIRDRHVNCAKSAHVKYVTPSIFFRNQQITIIIINIKTIIIIITITTQHHRLQQRRLLPRLVYSRAKCVVIPMNHILANIDSARLVIFLLINKKASKFQFRPLVKVILPKSN
jgi:hypothetical protein